MMKSFFWDVAACIDEPWDAKRERERREDEWLEVLCYLLCVYAEKKREKMREKERTPYHQFINYIQSTLPLFLWALVIGFDPL